LKVRQEKAGQIRNCPFAIWTIVTAYEDFTVKIDIYQVTHVKAMFFKGYRNQAIG
jgi:hypothetical protein